MQLHPECLSLFHTLIRAFPFRSQAGCHPSGTKDTDYRQEYHNHHNCQIQKAVEKPEQGQICQKQNQISNYTNDPFYHNYYPASFIFNQVLGASTLSNIFFSTAA